MKPLFADTSFYIALVSERDAYHERAVLATQQQRRRQVTTEYVLVETANWLAKSDRAAFCSFWPICTPIQTRRSSRQRASCLTAPASSMDSVWTRNGRSRIARPSW